MTAQKSVIPMNEHGRAITQEDIKPTVLPDAYLTSSIASALVDFKMPRFEDLPTVGLYRDQVIGIVEQTLSPLGTCIDGELLTPSMVNNYVKAGLIAAPVKKLYNREHVARLLVICIFKQVLSIQAIATLFKIQRVTYMVDVAFDYVAVELENASALRILDRRDSPTGFGVACYQGVASRSKCRHGVCRQGLSARLSALYRIRRLGIALSS